MLTRVIALVLAVTFANPAFARGQDLIKWGQAAPKAGDYDVALQSYTEAIGSNDLSSSELASAYYKRAGVFGYLGENIKGIEDYSKSLEINPDDGYAYGLRGYLRGVIGQYDLAEKDQQAALDLASRVDWPAYRPWVLQLYADLWRRRG